jgi:hypothetical protein
METQLDHIYLRPGIIPRAAAVGLAAVGVGTGVLLVCWGLSFFLHYNDPVVKKLDALYAQLETLAQNETENMKSPNYVIAQLVQKVGQQSSQHASRQDAIEQKLAAIGERIELMLKKQPQTPNLGDRHTPDGTIIRREVTVFFDVEHYGGNVWTGWRYKDGASNGPPEYQYCYWTTRSHSGQDTRIELAQNGQTIAAKLSNDERAERRRSTHQVPVVERVIRTAMMGKSHLLL